MPPPFVLPVTYTCRFWRDDATRNASRPTFCISGHTNHVAHNNQKNAPDLHPELFPFFTIRLLPDPEGTV